MKNSIKIYLFTDTLCDANGVSRFIQDISHNALHLNKDFHVYSSTRKHYCKKLRNIHNINPIFSMKMPFYPELDLVIPPFLEFKRVIKTQRPSLVHISTPALIGISASFFARLYGIPKIGTYHTDFPAYVYENTKSLFLKKLATLFIKRFYKNFEVIFVRSEEYRAIIAQELAFPKEKIFTLKAGIDIEKFHISKKDMRIWQAYQIDEESFKVLYVGRLTKEKNIDFLLSVWKQFTQKSPKKATLILVGDGEYMKYQEELKAFDVHFLGHKDSEALSYLYASSDLFIFPSTTDTLGQVVMEAMASGTPAMVSDVGGPKTIVQSQKNGAILSIENEAIWVAKLQEYMLNEHLLQKSSQNAFEHMQNYSIKSSFVDFWNVHLSQIER